ncbi:MAG: exodeoxyribonuclease VII large subunit [bacterium]
MNFRENNFLYPDSEKVYSVSQLVRGIRFAVQDSFPSVVWVEGEVSNLTFHSSGNVYFSLKDEEAVINCVVFKRMSGFLKDVLSDGVMALVCGRVDIYPKGGMYQIIVEKVKPLGRGALAIAFEKLKSKLAQKGYFDSERKRPLPFFINIIGIVTSPTGAAIRDLLRIIWQRNPSSYVILAPAQVQGVGSAESIVRGIEALNKDGRSQVLIVGRGGGSIEDLWAFNEEIVADAIYKSNIPVVSAVGHEIDFTIADFVADVRAPTPSSAAEMVTKRRSDIIQSLNRFQNQILSKTNNIITLYSIKLSNIKQSRGMIQPELILQDYIRRLDDAFSIKNKISVYIRGIYEKLSIMSNKLEETIYKEYIMNESRIHIIEERLSGFNPARILKRGYAYVEDENGINVGSVKDVPFGGIVKTTLYDGFFRSRVEDVNDDGKE